MAGRATATQPRDVRRLAHGGRSGSSVRPGARRSRTDRSACRHWQAPPWGDPANFDAEKAWDLIQRLPTEKAPNADSAAQVDDLKQAQQCPDRRHRQGRWPQAWRRHPADPAALAKQIADEQAKVTEAENLKGLQQWL
jgi:uncharacterized protein YecE (DUF72 family)